MGSDRTAWALVLAGVLAQMIYPALDGEPLRAITVAAVLLLSASALVHCANVFGRRAAGRLLLIGAGIGLTAEVVGVHFGVPFGSYRYADTLGPAIVGVPAVVPLAWIMLGYPCLLLGRRLAAGRRWARTGTATVGGWTLAAWDLFLDPQMVAAGHWTWDHPEPALPGVPGVPITNYLGWLLVSVLMIGVLDRALPPWSGIAAAPAVVLAWTWLGSTLGNLVLFDRPAVAGWGLLGMGVAVLPYLVLTVRDSRRRRSAADRPDLPVPAR